MCAGPIRQAVEYGIGSWSFGVLPGSRRPRSECLGIHKEALRGWVHQAEADAGGGTTG